MSNTPQNSPTPQEAMVNEALSALHEGDRSRARDLFTRLLKTGQDNPNYWVWMSAVVDTTKERAYCLKEALRLDPQNPAAQRGLLILGALPTGDGQAIPARLQKRNWQTKFAAGDGMDGSKGALKLSWRQYALMGAAFVIVFSLVGFAIFGQQRSLRQRRNRPVIIFPSSTAVAAVAVTATPTRPVSGSPVPLWMQLQATYTPTPLYVNTPHTVSEAYRIGVRAFQRSDWTGAQTYFQQVTTAEPGAVDILYYMGETYRQQGSYDQAISLFEEAIAKQPNFAPAYLGRARARLMLEPEQREEAMEDLQMAVRKDAAFGEAYLELGMLQVQVGDLKAGLRTLDQAESLMPGSPLVFLYRSQALLKQGDPEQALENARQANQLDITLLDAYRVIGEALQAQGDLRGSVQPLNTYVVYEPADPRAWQLLARAYLEAGEQKDALDALNRALRLDNRLGEAYLQRAGIFLEQGDAERALDDYEDAFDMLEESFDASIGMAKALMGLGYPGDAYTQVERSKSLAVESRQKAEWLYWRALTLEKLGEKEVALRDWQSLLAMPGTSVNPQWAAEAKRRIQAMQTSTPTAARQSTAAKTRTPTPKISPTKKP